MEIKRYPVKERYPGITNNTMSSAVRHNGVLYLCGQVADDNIVSIKDQTKNVLSNLDSFLEEHGSDKSSILSILIFIKDMSLVGEMNQVYEEWVDKDNAPVRACVEAALSSEEMLLELTVVAAVK